MRCLPVLVLLSFGCGAEDSDTEEEGPSVCNKTEADWEAAGATAQAVTICATSTPSCDCFVIGGSTFEEEHFCLMVAYDALSEGVTVTGTSGWSIDSSVPAGTDCSAGGVPCVGDLPSGADVLVSASEEEAGQSVEISFVATAARLTQIDVACP